VVFGGAARAIPPSRLRASGFELAGGPAAVGAGDLDRDGFDDLIAADCLAGTFAVLYGRASRGVLALDTGGRAGYRITGAGNCPAAVSGTLNARRHLLVGGCSSSTAGAGAAYVLPPRRRGAARVHAPSAATLRITSGAFVCPAGLADVNGDGRDDAVVSDGPRSLAVVFDALRRGTVDLGSLGTRGFRVTAAGELLAPTIAGDVNGDRRADIVFGDRTRTAAYVVFGKATSARIEATALGARGLTIRGERNTNFPFASAAAGDVDGDGLGDVLLGAPGAVSRGDGDTGGSAFVVYGRRSGGDLSVATLGPGALRIDGTHRGSAWGIGGSLASISDMDGDGRRELAIAGGYEGIAHVLLSTGLGR
jgi:hypothetical protein